MRSARVYLGAASCVRQRYGKLESFRAQHESAHSRANFGWRDLKKGQERYSEFRSGTRTRKGTGEFCEL